MTSTPAILSTDLATCPRCAGFPNAFARFPHVNGGRCLHEIGHGSISLMPPRLNFAARTTKELDYEADNVQILVRFALPASDPNRIREVATAIANALRAVGIE